MKTRGRRGGSAATEKLDRLLRGAEAAGCRALCGRCRRHLGQEVGRPSSVRQSILSAIMRSRSSMPSMVTAFR